MNILFYRYNSICEPAIIRALQSLGLTVVEETSEMENKSITPAKCVEIVSRDIREHKPVFVFSINFYPAISQVCQLFQIPYLCWTVDSPVPELFSTAITNSANRIFLFDSAQYQTFARYNQENIYYLPLAADIEHYNKVTASITAADREKFHSDISFVGSLYNEKNPFDKISGLSDYTKGFVDALTEASLRIYGYNPVEDALPGSVTEEIKNCATNFYTLEQTVTNPDRYVAAHSYVGMHIAEVERIRTLNTLAEYFKVDLYTRSDCSDLVNVHVHDGVSTLTEMPKIFHLSKINLNMTIKPIQNGLPLRIFDILGCGGFAMTNFQADLPECFDIGVDLEAYGSMEELVEKCDYYLKHEDERKQIALNGYQRVCNEHTYIHRIRKMLETII